MCSSFYGQAPLPAAAGDELENIIMISEEELEKGEENERQQGDLADMVRSSANHDRLRRRRGSDDDIYPQDVCSSNHIHHQNNMILWSSLTSADELICSVDHNRINSTTTSRSNMSCQECCCLQVDDDHNIIVEYMQAAAAANDVADETTAIDQHPPLIHPINNHYNNNDMFLSPQQELLHDDDLPLITTTISSGVSMKSFNYSKSAAAAAQEAAQDHRQRANNQTSYLHSSTTTCPANNTAPPATVAYVTSIITTHGRHSTSSTASSSSVSGCRQQQQLKPPINCNVFSQMLHISSSSTNVDMLLSPPSSKMVQQLHPQQQASSTSSLALAAVVGSGSGNDHITSSNYSTRHHSSSGSMPAEQMLLINEDQNRIINCTATTAGCDMSTLLHISSSPSNPAIKRSRKSLSKKVVCIPAPTPANSRPSGEVVPSDLWAWRKYGQKPIKGSPYPRGYYRCSSSKGCSARKQVERSRTDPNMLVITYTSEHNHPWPTQRNALAGSIRSHPSKNSTTCASNSASWTSGVNDQMKIRRISIDSNIGSDELKPADEMGAMICKQQQQKVLDDHDHVVVDASVQDYSNYHDQREDINSNGDCELEDEHYWRCSYKIDRPEEHNEQSVQEDFFGELGEIAGKDHNGFSSFLMDYSASDKAVMYMNHAS